MFGVKHHLACKCEACPTSAHPGPSPGSPGASLADLADGEEATITEIMSDEKTKARLEALGLRAGIVIRKKSQALNGGPVIFEAGATQLALGEGVASRIAVIAASDARLPA